jgi:signal transduction histidine kinase
LSITRRFSPFSKGAWVAASTWVLTGAATNALAQGPTQAAAATQPPSWTSASLPYAVAAILTAIVILLLFNQKLQHELRMRKRAERKLRLAEQAKTELLDSVADSVIYLDTDLCIRWANRSARGGPRPIPDNMMGDHCYAVWGDGKAPCRGCPVPETLMEGTPCECRAVRGREGRCWQVQSYPVTIDGGAPRGIVVICRDVTETLVKEAELLKARKLESVGVLAGGIAHDFNNMLTAVMGYISLAELKQAGGSEAETHLRKATAAADRAKRLATRLLTFSQGGHPIRRRAGVAKLVTKAVGNAGEGREVRIHTEIDPQCHVLWCDGAQIQQAIENVIVNACESMPSGGEALVKAACTEIDADSAVPLLPGGYLRIGVSDRGVGIPAEIADKVFDPYFTTKPMGADKGCGLGLAITHSIVQRHRGYVSVAARPGGGTTVSILLPLECADPLHSKTAATAEAKPAPLKGERILVLEDEPLVWEVAEMLLSHLGYRASHAPHGQAAVDQFKAAQAAGAPFGTVILDLTIKGGMGGQETLEVLRRFDPGVRAFVSSGYSSDPVLTDYQSFGFSGVIPKPYTLGEIKRALASEPEPSECARAASR